VEATLKLLRTVRLVLLASIGLYLIVCFRAPVKPTSKPITLQIIGVIALTLVGWIIYFRRKIIAPADIVLSAQPDDQRALARLRLGYILIWALCEAMALYGFVLRYMGFPFAQVIPFFVGGFVLMLFMAPRRPAESR
jgi:hypothetical protein